MSRLGALSVGAIVKLKGVDDFQEPVVLKVKTIELKDTKYHAELTDGIHDIAAVLGSQLTELAKDGSLSSNAVVKVTGYTANNVSGRGMVLMVTALEVLDVKVELSTPLGDANVNIALQPTTPGAIKGGAQIKTAGKSSQPLARTPTPAGRPTAPQPSPPSAPPSISTRTSGFAKIASLHPYDDSFRLQAKLGSKEPLRTISAKGKDMAVLTITLIDDEGSQIQGTFWREQASRWSEFLEEGKVYVFEKFTVKVANKQYARVKNDYELTFTDKTEVSEAANQSAGEAMTAAVDITPIEQLPRFVTRKAPVDVMGVLVTLAPVGNVKRKSDGSDVARRDITITDKSCKTVVLTLWGDSVAKASELEGLELNTLVQVTACRVTDYNGCSLSTLSRATLIVAPQSAAATEMLEWWEAHGRNATLTPVGASLPGARGSGGAGGAGSNVISTLKEVTEQAVPEVDAKPVYQNVVATVVNISAEQTMYYLANPENGKKVVEQEGRFWCEGDAKYVETATNRYVLNLRVMDSSGDGYVTLFNEQAEMVMGVSADELASAKLNDEDAFNALLKAARWSSWTLGVATKSREYQGEKRLRHTGVTARHMDFVRDSQRLLDIIARY